MSFSRPCLEDFVEMSLNIFCRSILGINNRHDNPSFQRPQSDSNVLYNLPQFAELSVLDDGPYFMWKKVWCTLNAFFILKMYNAPCLLTIPWCYQFFLSFVLTIVPFCPLIIMSLIVHMYTGHCNNFTTLLLWTELHLSDVSGFSQVYNTLRELTLQLENQLGCSDQHSQY